jgi:hypothetical protein
LKFESSGGSVVSKQKARTEHCWTMISGVTIAPQSLETIMASQNGHSKQSQIQSWLSGQGLRLTEVQSQNMQWVLTWKDPAGYAFMVAQSKQVPDQIVIQSTFGIDGVHKKHFLGMDGTERRLFLRDLKIAILALGVGFEGAQEPFDQVTVVQHVYEDGLTKDRFFQCLGQIRCAVTLAAIKVGYGMENPPS